MSVPALGAIAVGIGQVLQAASAATGALTGDPDHGLPLVLFVAGSVRFVPGLLALTVAILRAKGGYRWLGLSSTRSAFGSSCAASIADGPTPMRAPATARS